MISEGVRRAARALADTPLRTTLTVSGITIGIAALFSLLSIAEGIRARIVDEWLSSGLMTSLAVMPEGVASRFDPGGERQRSRARERDRPNKSVERRALDGAAVGEIAAIEGVRRVWPIVTRSVEIVPEVKPSAVEPALPAAGEGEPPESATNPDETPGSSEGRKPFRVTLRGFDTDFFWSEDYVRIVAGRPLTQPGVAEALLVQDRLEALGLSDPAAALGQRLHLRWREPVELGTAGAEPLPGLPIAVLMRTAEFTVVGVFERRGALSLRNTGVIVPTARAEAMVTFDPERIRSLFDGGGTGAGFPGLDVYIEPGADLDAIEKRIRGMGFDTISGAEIAGRIRRSILILQAVLAGLGSIAIAVATLGIANTLVTAVFERMREIGVMKAVGARRRDVRRQFLLEAGLIGLSGGLLGVAGGFAADHLLAIVIGQIVRRQGGDDPGAIAQHTPGIALGCIAFSILLSILAGTFPAARAARLDPIRTLRHE